MKSQRSLQLFKNRGRFPTFNVFAISETQNLAHSGDFRFCNKWKGVPLTYTFLFKCNLHSEIWFSSISSQNFGGKKRISWQFVFKNLLKTFQWNCKKHNYHYHFSVYGVFFYDGCSLIFSNENTMSFYVQCALWLNSFAVHLEGRKYFWIKVNA